MLSRWSILGLTVHNDHVREETVLLMPSKLCLPDHIQRLHKIGQGSFGEVFKGLDKNTGTFVAIKVVNLEEDNEGIEEIKREVSVLCHCSSPYVIKYHGSYLNGSQLWIVMDYCGVGSLRQILESVGTIPESLLPFIAKEILKALSYLHANQIIHRDVKAANILVTEEGHIKLGDFGVASQTRSKLRRGSIVGSPYWMAPEVIKQNGYNTKADIWSFGIAMIELLTGNPPLAHLGPSSAVDIISKSRYIPKLEGNFSQEAKTFVNQCFQEYPEKRPSADQLLKFKFLRNAKTSAPKSPLLPIISKYIADKEKIKNIELEHQPELQNSMACKTSIDWNFDTQEVVNIAQP